jgi:two-component system, NtrC family, response regulator PilR
MAGEGDSLKRRVFALVVHDRPEPCQALKPVLRHLGVDTFSVSGCADAFLLLEQTHPHLIFTDTQLPDGTWIDLVNLTDGAAVSTCVILVGGSKDPEVSQAALNYGAFGFISPPFDAETISQIVSRALTQVFTHREHRLLSVA